MEYFVSQDSVVRKIWGSTDTVLFIFAGAAAEFALNKAVDWLYFTGRLPADPLGRLFSTVTYSRKILFSTTCDAYAAIDQITAIHRNIETERGSRIPGWAYRDVLYLLIDYTIRSYELLERPLNVKEKNEIFDTFYRLGIRMQLENLPVSYAEWLVCRRESLEQDLRLSEYSHHLFKQYQEHLGAIRYALLKNVQAKLVPQRVAQLLGLKPHTFFSMLLTLYKWSKLLNFQKIIINTLLPLKYKSQLLQLDHVPV